jgi:hypothetical protein
MHSQCDGEMPLHHQQKLHTQGFFGVPTGKNPEDSNVAGKEVTLCFLLYLSTGHKYQ